MVAVILLAAFIVPLSVARAERSWARESHLGYAEGIWLGLALDTAHGVFYRPLEGPLGYGGTRYFPLFFGLHGGLIRLGFSPIAAGHLLATAALALLVAGVFVFVRRVGGGLTLALGAASVALACQPVQMALLSIRGDGLPAALTILGLAAAAGSTRVNLASLCFVLAFAAKPTSLYGPLAAALSLFLSGRRSDAVRVAVSTAAGMAMVLAVMVGASGNAVLSTFAASASGGAGLGSLLAAPLTLARVLRRVPESTFFIELTAAWILLRAGRARSLEVISALVCLGVTVVIYASPATIENHLIDLTVLSVLVVAGLGARHPDWERAVFALLVVGGLSAATSAAWRYRTEDALWLGPARQHAVEAVANAQAPVFFQQPMLAARARQQSYVLDPFQFSIRVSRDPNIADRLLRDLDRRAFGAVVLEHSSIDLAVLDFAPGEAGRRFRDRLEQNYRLETIIDGRPIFRPRTP